VSQNIVHVTDGSDSGLKLYIGHENRWERRSPSPRRSYGRFGRRRLSGRCAGDADFAVCTSGIGWGCSTNSLLHEHLYMRICVATSVPILDYKSRVSAARKTPPTQSLRTTIPEEVARLLELKPGDVLKWAYDTKQEGKVVVRK
jgi:hypothetical protein